MEIDMGTALIGLIIICICIIPFVIMHYNRVKKENKVLRALNENAQKYNCMISQHEFCGDFVIGIDEERNFVFFLKQKKEETVYKFVDLSEMQACQVVKMTRNVKNNNGGLGYIDRIELSFIPTNKKTAETRFELYVEEINMQLGGELQLVEKWSKQINDRLKHHN